MEQKEIYQRIEMEVYEFTVEDIITNSPGLILPDDEDIY